MSKSPGKSKNGGPPATNSLKTISLSRDKVRNILTVIFIEEQIEEEARNKIKKLESQLNEVKSEHYNLVRTNKEQSEKLTKELENTMKSNYVKNVLFSYLTTADQTVHANLVKVLVKAMHFTEEEGERIMQF